MCSGALYGSVIALSDTSAGVASCAAGYYCFNNSLSPYAHACPAGQFSLSGSSNCSNCSAGYTCPDASPNSTVITCPAGTYSVGGTFATILVVSGACTLCSSSPVTSIYFACALLNTKRLMATL